MADVNEAVKDIPVGADKEAVLESFDKYKEAGFSRRIYKVRRQGDNASSRPR